MSKSAEYMRRYRASKSSAMSAGGNATVTERVNTVESRISDLDLKQVISSSSFPAITGANEKEIAEGEAARKEFRKSLYQYVVSRDDDGRPIAPDVFNGYMTGTAQERADYVQKRAETLSFGNESLVSGKLETQILAQNAMSDRIKRMRDVMTAKTSAKWWKANANSAAISSLAKKYVDGKLSASDAKAAFGI